MSKKQESTAPNVPLVKTSDPREKIRKQLLEIINQYGNRKMLALRAGTTEQYLSMLSNHERYPGLNILISILHECGYDLQITKATPRVYELLQRKAAEEK